MTLGIGEMENQNIKNNINPTTTSATTTMNVKNEYIKLTNYRGHLNTNPNFVHFGEINEHSLSGIMLKISHQNDNSLSAYYSTCDALTDCIGFSIHPTVGVLFHNFTVFPLQYVRNWHFFVKNTTKNKEKCHQMTHFTNARINYTFELISSSNIASLSSLNLAYSVPIIPRKFMSFEWNLGRTNNQLYSFEAMLQYVAIYGRTLILPFASHRNHELGMMNNQSLSIWDMLKLSEFADFIFEHELAQHSLPSNLSKYVLINNNDIDYEKKTWQIGLNEEDKKWKEYFSKNRDNDDPNWNLLELLKFRKFTNNAHWSLGHENKIHNDWSDEWQCFVSRGIRNAIPHKTLSNCRLINFCLGRFNHFKLDDWPIFDVLKFIIPAPRIRNAVDNMIKFWFERRENYRIGVHRRAMKEGGKDSSGSPYVCRFAAKSLSKSGRYAGLRSHIEKVIGDEAKSDGITDLYDRTCAISFDSIEEILAFHRQSALTNNEFMDNRIKEYNERSGQRERWFLACDNQEPEILKSLIDEKGAITLNGLQLADYWKGPSYWNMDAAMENQQNIYNVIVEKQYLKFLKLFETDKEIEREHNEWNKIKNDGHKPRWWYEMSKIEFWRKEIVVFDMWMLKEAQFFVGSWHSTLTRNVCHWRGYEQMYNSTNCYLVHKWRAMHDVEHYKPPINGKWPFEWYDLNAIKGPKLIWKDGK